MRFFEISIQSITFQTFQIYIINFLNEISREKYGECKKLVKFHTNSTHFPLRSIWQTQRNGNCVKFPRNFTSFLDFKMFNVLNLMFFAFSLKITPWKLRKSSWFMQFLWRNFQTERNISILAFRSTRSNFFINSCISSTEKYFFENVCQFEWINYVLFLFFERKCMPICCRYLAFWENSRK